MDNTGFCDYREVKQELRLSDDSRFSNSRFAAASLKANGEIIDALRPKYDVEKLFLKNQTDETIEGTTTSEGTNIINVSGASWTTNVFTESSIGFKVEAIIYKDSVSSFWVADIVSNDATSITISDISGADITIPISAKFYLRIKHSGLNNIAVGFAMYNFLVNNRTSQGIAKIADSIKDRRGEEAGNLGLYLGGTLALFYPKATDSITFSGSTWQRLSNQNIDSKSVVITKSGTQYYSEQGFEIDYIKGRIRYKAHDSDQSNYLGSSDTISVVYRYKLRGSLYGAI